MSEKEQPFTLSHPLKGWSNNMNLSHPHHHVPTPIQRLRKPPLVDPSFKWGCARQDFCRSPIRCTPVPAPTGITAHSAPLKTAGPSRETSFEQDPAQDPAHKPLHERNKRRILQNDWCHGLPGLSLLLRKSATLLKHMFQKVWDVWTVLLWMNKQKVRKHPKLK